MNVEEDKVDQFENEWMGVGRNLGINQLNGGLKALQE